MLDSHDIDPTDSAYSQQGPLDGLEPIAKATEQLLAGGCSLNSLTDDQLRALLAYEYWDDGADDDEFILSVWKTDNAWTRDRVIETLVEVFGFTK